MKSRITIIAFALASAALSILVMVPLGRAWN
jgi:hypothetical protein